MEDVNVQIADRVELERLIAVMLHGGSVTAKVPLTDPSDVRTQCHRP